MAATSCGDRGVRWPDSNSLCVSVCASCIAEDIDCVSLGMMVPDRCKGAVPLLSLGIGKLAPVVNLSRRNFPPIPTV